jgi:hypothetical protein
MTIKVFFPNKFVNKSAFLLLNYRFKLIRKMQLKTRKRREKKLANLIKINILILKSIFIDLCEN